ncbi:MAG: adenylate/guanylate cyclase domain-containing protein [Planctomycetales bacterium]|nr:adenylate/guanylate cyclase domain-containing protein [Planctomycetales bacterium]
MPDLIAQGERPHQRWRRSLSAGAVVLGRAAGPMSVGWDTQVSRQHAELTWQDDVLHVRKLPEARNPIFVRGSQQDEFEIHPGEHFVIGATTFSLADERVQATIDSPRPHEEKTYSQNYLKQVRFRNADQRIDVLSRLPEVIRDAANEQEMLVRVINILLAGLQDASAVAVVQYLPDAAEQSAVRVQHWDRRLLSGEDFQPSQSLIRRAMETRESVVHVWAGGSAHEFTASENADWAFCTPLSSEAYAGWGIYVTGSFGVSASDSDSRDLHDDLKFTELAASTLSSIGDLKLLERRHAGLSQFFSPVVLRSLVAGDPEAALAPRECDVSVMFCDLRGFSRRTEQNAHDLLGLLERVSRAMGVMTHHILEEGGVVGDFHGDAAMGFWGWPLPQDDAVERACRAALGIRRVFLAAARAADHPLTDFRMGIGIATGRAVAGKIGSVDQVKATVFGPVVNLASRLEGMTKTLRASILLDEVSASILRETAPDCRLRRVARVRPYGMDLPLEVTELLPPVEEDTVLTDEHVAAYEAALDALHDRQWQQAFELLHQVPAMDRVKDFLTVFIAQHNRSAPERWDGVIPLAEK